jgi:transcriptional regulator with XRE-family HTH domain
MRIGELIRLYRNVEGFGVRDMAAEIGVSAATLSRVERGEMMNGRTLARVTSWLFED